MATRMRTTKQRLRLGLTAGVIFALGSMIFHLSAGDESGSTAPLSFRLVEQSPTVTGLHFQHQFGHFAPFFDNVLPFMRAVSAAACAADIDNDGFVDVFMLSAGPTAKNRLFKNSSRAGALRFEPWSIPVIEDLNSVDGFSSDCVFADVDNDGDQDLFVGTVSQAPRLFLQQPNTDGTPVFVDGTVAAGLPATMNGFAASFVDLDNDADLDLVFASYFGEHYLKEDIPHEPAIKVNQVPEHKNAGRMLPNNWGNADNGGQKHLLMNDGNGRFTTIVPDSVGLTETRFTFDIGTADVDQDGFVDLYFANDFGPDQLYLNRGGGKSFEIVRGTFPTDIGRDPFKGMNADLADMDHDGFPEIYVTNVHHPVLPEGNLLWHNRPDPEHPGRRIFQNIAADTGVKAGGWGWGAKFVDIDLDTDTDLIATNGYISQSPEREYWYRLSRLVAGNRRFIVDTRKWPAFEDRSMSGHETSHVFVREGARFWNRALEVGVTRSFDGRGVLLADFDKDGRPEVLFVTQGQPYSLMLNEFVPTTAQPTAPHWVGLVVQGDGVSVNRDGVGVHVVVTAGDATDPLAPLPLHREISAGNGMSAQSSSWVNVGLGAYRGPVDVELRWTNGTTTMHKALTTDRYHTLTQGAP